MRKTIKIPRILKINWIKDHSVSVVFNNGESRIIEFLPLFKHLGIDKNEAISILLSPKEFRKVKVHNNTLSWNNVIQWISLKNGKKQKVPFEIGADVLLKFSQPEQSPLIEKIGQLVKTTRLELGLTQHQLAVKSGTTRTYISRIENQKSDIELATLRKIIEFGLGKHLEITIK